MKSSKFCIKKNAPKLINVVIAQDTIILFLDFLFCNFIIYYIYQNLAKLKIFDTIILGRFSKLIIFTGP